MSTATGSRIPGLPAVDHEVRRSVATADWARLARQLGAFALCALPGLLTFYLSFNSGGYFAGAQGIALAVLATTVAIRVVVVRAPFSGLSRHGRVAIAGLAAYTGWALLSSRWSHSPSRALLSFELDALYVFAIVLFGSSMRSHRRVRWMLGLTWAAMLAVCASAVATRLRPDLFPIPAALSPNRLAFPLTYWNALGLFATVGLVLSCYLAASRQGPRPLRVFATGTMPVFAVTILLTYSRAGLLLAAVGIVAYALLGRPRGLIGALIAGLPTSAVAMLSTYHAKLVSNAVNSPVAVAQGKHVVTVIVAACLAAACGRAALLGLDERLSEVTISAKTRRTFRWLAGLLAGAAVLVALVGFHSRIAVEWHRFLQQDSAVGSNDVRNRIDAVHLGSRLPGWRIALHVFSQHPLNGGGADTFPVDWYRLRPDGGAALQAHSLYLQAMSELGLVGLAALLVAIGALLVACFRRRRRAARTMWSAVIVVALLWAVHGAVDWDWQMPAVTLPVLALASTALARRGAASRLTSRVELPLRVAVAAISVGVALVAINLAVSDTRLSDSVNNFNLGACPAAITDARASSAAISSRPQPYAIVAYCEMLAGTPQPAIAEMRRAVRLDPENWRYYYGLGVVEAAAGRDPMPALRLAQTLDPHEAMIADAEQAFAGKSPNRRSAAARDVQRPVSMRQ